MIGRPRIHRLDWDDWNRDHIVKHAVHPTEAEVVVAGDAIVHEGYEQRLVATGPTFAGRMLTVVIGAVPNQAGVFYVFSARPASRRERCEYRQEKGNRNS